MPDAAPDLVIVGREELTPIPPRPTPRHAPRPPRAAPRRSGIAARTRDIIAANVTDLLDQAEDPAKMIRLVIAEMEETLIEARASAARIVADRKEMHRRVARLDMLQESWAEKAGLALSKDREDLARAALAEKQKAADTAAQLAAAIAALDATLQASDMDVARLEARLREARSRRKSFVTRLESAQQRARLREMVAGPRVEEAFARFDLLERRVDMAEGRAAASLLAAPAKGLEEEIAELRTAERVEAELASMKAARAGART
ncbi:PspA/IM30 family protein [Enterovirga sp. GCM10030262]|uniref:PspA/IM30 family protein n=1 Tax=Enterovirga sp. GCM10030262 TaxID=3273391 RepID=UPI00360D2CDD